MDRLFLISRHHWWERVNNTAIEFHLSETDHTEREPGRTAWQTETLLTVLFPHPHLVIVQYELEKLKWQEVLSTTPSQQKGPIALMLERTPSALSCL